MIVCSPSTSSYLGIHGEGRDWLLSEGLLSSDAYHNSTLLPGDECTTVVSYTAERSLAVRLQPLVIRGRAKRKSKGKKKEEEEEKGYEMLSFSPPDLDTPMGEKN